jgi:dTDP-4-dehydrorhamnose 3,5-epimerase-like enzyme
MNLVQLFNFTHKSDERGASLIAIEGLKTIPFAIQRVYYIQINTLHAKPRGYHAHHQLRQIAICLSGNCRFVLDDGLNRVNINLDSSMNNQGLLIDKMIWHEMHDFSADCLLLLLASLPYDSTDYIHDYLQFKQYLGMNQ